MSLILWCLCTCCSVTSARRPKKWSEIFMLDFFSCLHPVHTLKEKVYIRVQALEQSSLQMYLFKGLVYSKGHSRVFATFFNLCWKFRAEPLDGSKSPVCPPNISKAVRTFQPLQYGDSTAFWAPATLTSRNCFAVEILCSFIVHYLKSVFSQMSQKQ